MPGKSTRRTPQSGSSGPTAKPVAPAAKPTAVATKAATSAARKKIDPGKDLIPKKEKYPKEVRNIKGKWGEYARAATDFARENGMSLKDPMVRFAMVLCAFMGKYARYVDLVPGNFRKSLDKDELSKEKLSKLQKAKLRAQMSKEVPKNLREFSALYKAENDKRIKDKKPVLDATETSTLYVSYLLFGSPLKTNATEPKVDYLTDHKVLAARLSHEYTDLKRGQRAYGDSTLKALKKMEKIPKGTVIFFSPNFKSGIIAAYATGNRKEFIYYVPGSKDRKSFQLDASTSPIKNELGLMAAFVPTHLQGAVPTPKAAPVSPTKAPPTSPEALASTLTTTVADVEKQLREARKQKNIALKYTKVADILSTSIAKVENAVKKGKLLKHEKALKKYHALITTVLKTKEIELKKNAEQLKNLPAQIKDASTKNKKKVAAGLEIQFFLATMHKKAFTMIKPYLDKIREYLKRSADLLPKSASK